MFVLKLVWRSTCFNDYYFFSLPGRLQGTLGELGARRPDRRRPGFLHGLFYQGQALGLIGPRKDSNPAPRAPKKPTGPPCKYEKIIKAVFQNSCHPRIKLRFVHFLLKKVGAKLPVSTSISFLFERSKNFVFLLALHLRIFLSLAFSKMFCSVRFIWNKNLAFLIQLLCWA